MCSILVKPIGEVQGSSSKKFNVGNVFIAKKFDTCKGLLKKFDIYSKIVFRDLGNFAPRPDKSALRHPYRVSNFSINFIYLESFFFTEHKIPNAFLFVIFYNFFHLNPDF